jgi:hypothetical protein
VTPATTLRVARPTDRLDEVVRFYTAGGGLTRLGGFEAHTALEVVSLAIRRSSGHQQFRGGQV